MKIGIRIKKRVIDVDINVKVNVDADEAIAKLERIRDLYKEINELSKDEVSIQIDHMNKIGKAKIRTAELRNFMN